MKVSCTLEPLPYPSVVTFGNFDGVHLGHVALLSALSDFGNAHSLQRVVVTFDPHPLCFLEGKDDFLIVSKDVKIDLLSPYADYLYFIKFDEDFRNLSPKDFLWLLASFVNIKCLINAENCRFGRCSVGDVEDLKKYQDLFSYKSITIKSKTDQGERYSSTLVRTSLKEGDMLRASRLLGRHHSILGVIEKDRGLAGTIGFPTINISLPSEIIKPKFGVYVADVLIKGTMYRGVANIGKRPTTCDSEQIVLEMHIFNFSDNVYGETAQVYLKAFLREERRFASIEKLREQILLDVQAVLSQTF